MPKLKTILITRDEALADVITNLPLATNVELRADCRSVIEAVNVIGKVVPDSLFVDLDLPDLNPSFLFHEPIRIRRVLFILGSGDNCEQLLEMKTLFFWRSKSLEDFKSVLSHLESFVAGGRPSTPRQWINLLTNRYRLRSRRVGVRIGRHFRVIDQSEIYPVEFGPEARALITTGFESYVSDEAAFRVVRRLDKIEICAANGQDILEHCPNQTVNSGPYSEKLFNCVTERAVLLRAFFLWPQDGEVLGSSLERPKF